jgi:hypothetical protein
MSKFWLHYFNHAGFLALEEIEVESVEDAAYKQMLSRHDFLTEEGATPHTWKARRRDNWWIDIAVYADALHPIFGGTLQKGDYWFKSSHRLGEKDDCRSCGGTGGDHYRLFRTQCWACGESGKPGSGSCKQRPPTEQCDWDPQNDQPAVSDGSGCQNQATTSVGGGMDNWHLCDPCAALPRFKKYRRRVALVRGETA